MNEWPGAERADAVAGGDQGLQLRDRCRLVEPGGAERDVAGPVAQLHGRSHPCTISPRGCGPDQTGVAGVLGWGMRAVVYERYGERPVVREVPAPTASTRGVVVRVEATGLCRSDIHGWLGHDDGIALPHVPGHELVGRIESVGPQVRRFAVGERVTTPFVCACGQLPRVPQRQRAGLPQPDPARLHPLGVVRRAGRAARRRRQPGPAPGLGRRRLGRTARLPVRDGLPRGRPARPGGPGRDLAGRRLRRGRAQLRPGRRRARGAGRRGGCRGVRAAACGRAGRRRRRRHRRARPLRRRWPPSPRLPGPAASRSRWTRSVGPRRWTSASARSARRGRHVQIGLLAAEPVVPMTAVIAEGAQHPRGATGWPPADYPELVDLVTSGALQAAGRRRATDHAGRGAGSDGSHVPQRLPGVTVIEVSP